MLIVLERVRRVEGRVLRSDGSPAGEGLLVLAWVRDGGTPAPAQVAWAMQRERAVVENLWTVRTDARGAFVFDELPADEALRLDTGGRGLLAIDELPADGVLRLDGGGRGLLAPGPTSSESESTVELRVRPGFAVQLVLEETDGRPPRYGGAQPLASSWCRFPGAGMTSGVTPGAIAAGLEPALAEQRADRWALLVHAETEEERVGPVHVRIELPGYAPLEAQVEAEALERPTPLVRIALERLAPGFGELRLKWIGAPFELADFAPQSYGAGVVELQPLEGSSPHRYDVEPDQDLRATLVDVPAGTFLASFRLGRQRFATGPAEGEPTRVTIGAEPAHFTIDLSRTGTGFLLLDVQDPAGGSWNGRVGGTLSSPGQMEFFALQEPPYLFAGLSPGVHMLRPSGPIAAPEGSTSRSLRAAIEPGLLTRLRLSVAAR